jgi:predicted AAA+ superfamily ATPase
VPGQYILSGSQSFLLNERISQSLAGRVSVNHLFPFDVTEYPTLQELSPAKAIHQGFYPRLYDHLIAPQDFYPSYLQTYIERDIRNLRSVENLQVFSRFLGLCAGRTGQILNLTSLANDAGVAVNTAKSWLSLLESSYIIYLLQPYYKNFNKRLIKSPKLYFYDTGIVSSLLKISSPEQVSAHYLYGALFENLILNEIIKYHYHMGKRPSIYYWRESNGTEIDCIVEKNDGTLIAIEIKGGSTFNKDFLKSLKNFPIENPNLETSKILLFAGDENSMVSGIRITNWKSLSSLLKSLI